MRTFPGPERGARNSSPEVGVSPRVAPPPWASQGHRDADGRTPGRSPGGEWGGALLVQGSPLPQIGARARNGRAGAHGAAAPPDPGRGAPWEAGWEGPRRAPPAPPRGPRRFRSPRGRPGSQDEPPGLCVAGKSLFLSPHYRGQRLLPHPKLGLGDEAAIHRVGGSHFLLGKLRPGGVDALRLYPPCDSSGREPWRVGTVVLLAPHVPSPRPPHRNKPVLSGKQLSEGPAPSPSLCSPARTFSCCLSQPGLGFRDAASHRALIRRGPTPGLPPRPVPQCF